MYQTQGGPDYFPSLKKEDLWKYADLCEAGTRNVEKLA